MNTAHLSVVFGQIAATVLDRLNDYVVTHADAVVFALVATGIVLIALFRKWVWREFSALQTAQIFMILLLPFLFAGALLPQDGNYEALEHAVKLGWMVRLAKGLRLMNVFHATPFYVLLTAIMITALVCSLHHLRALLRLRAPAGPSREEVMGSVEVLTLQVAEPFAPEGLAAVYNALNEGGLRGPHVPAKSPPHSAVLEMGSGTLWPAVLFHLGMVLLAIGCLVTWLFGFGGYVRLYMGQTEEAPLVSHETRWHSVRRDVCAMWDKWFGGGEKESSAPTGSEAKKPPALGPDQRLSLGLEKITPVYEQWPSLNYPCYDKENRRGWRTELAVQRFKSAWGWGREELKGNLSTGPSEPAEISAKVHSYIADERSLVHHLRSGHSIRTEGLDLSLIEADFKVDIEVEKAPPLKGLVQGAVFKIPGAVSQYRIDDVTAGTYVAFDGRRTEPAPKVYILPLPLPQPAMPATPQQAGAAQAAPPAPARTVLPLGQWGQLGGRKVRVTAVTDGCILRYQHDPGEYIWRIAAILLFLALCARVYWSHYRIRVFLEKSEGRTALHAGVDAHGIFSDPHRAFYAVKDALRSKDMLAEK